MGKVKSMLTQWVGDSLSPLDASYETSPSSSETEATASSAPAEEAPVEEAPADDGGMSQGECAGPEGCEIVWD